jgi:AraC-like DNA-binding protein
VIDPPQPEGTPADPSQALRLTLVKDLLETGDLLVSDVTRWVGYESDAAFSRASKAQFGIAPKAQRLRHTRVTEMPPSLTDMNLSVSFREQDPNRTCSGIAGSTQSGLRHHGNRR